MVRRMTPGQRLAVSPRRLTLDQRLVVSAWRRSKLSAEDFAARPTCRVSAATLRRWGRRYDAGPDDRPDSRPPQSIIDSDPDMRDHAAGLLADRLSMTSAKLHRELVMVFGKDRVPSQSAVQRWRTKNHPKPRRRFKRRARSR